MMLETRRLAREQPVAAVGVRKLPLLEAVSEMKIQRYGWEGWVLKRSLARLAPLSC